MRQTLINNNKLAGKEDFAEDSYLSIRNQTAHLEKTLSDEAQCVQSMTSASPTKWHLAHTTWFFETFILKTHMTSYNEFDSTYSFLFNSYYEQIGERHARDMRGLLTRPSLEQIYAYRRHVDISMKEYLRENLSPDQLQLVQLHLDQLMLLSLHH